MDLGSHVARGTKLGLEETRVVSSSDGSCESQIRDFEHVVAVKEQILRLEVTMSIALCVHEAEPIEKLLEVVASSSLGKTTTESDEVEKLTAADKLKYDKLDLLLAFLGIVLLALADLDEAHDIAVLELRQS